MDYFLKDFQVLTETWWPCIIALVITFIGALRIYFGGMHCPCNTKIDGKVVIITGGSSGIGLETAKELAKRGGKIILAIRDASKGEKARNRIKKAVPNGRVVVKFVDLTNFDTIRNFVIQMEMEFEKIDMLINNAGIYKSGKANSKTIDGNDVILSTNYLGPFLLTHLLLPLLRKSEKCRVINISSSSHFGAQINLNEFNQSEEQEVIRNQAETYAQSKLALAMFTKEMSLLLKNTKINFYTVNPGLVRGTGHLASFLENESFNFKLLIAPWIWLFMKTAEQGCQSVVFAAVEPKLDDISGCYLSDCEIKKASDLVENKALVGKLYKKTCRIVDYQENFLKTAFESP